MEPSEVHRQMDIQNLFLSIKWSILNLLAVDIPFYFYNNKIISPSIEYFQIKNMFENCNKRKATILENIGVNAAIASGVWDQSKQTNKIYEEYYKTGINSNSIKIITDIDKMNDNQKKEFEIIKDYVYRELIIPVVISTIVNDIYNTLGTNKAKVFRSSKSKIKYGELFKVRLEIEENNVLLRSLENDINYNRFDSIINDIKDCLNIDSDNNVVNNLFNRSINDLENIKRDIKLNKEMLDDIISLLNIKSNRKGQNITIALTIITVILTAITIWISIKTVGS